MSFRYFFFQLWGLVVDHVLPLAALLLMAILVPRIGRLVVRVVDSRLDDNEETTKARLALTGALVYVAQAVAYFLLAIAALANLGVPALGAAIPATVVSAALGFGAQKIIGDFLAGFFILSEKQYGVGDYVSFDGTSTTVEGTVVALTLRTTKVRTPTGEVVMVPNGSGGVVTNYSQDWSRAVVDLQVPVHAGETLSEVTRQVEEISTRAIRDAAIAADIAGDIEILPVTGLIEPTVAGQPWQVKYRVMVVVNPSRQWAVERGIRSALVAAFWDHYNLGEVPSLADAPSGSPVAGTTVPAAPGEPTEAFAAQDTHGEVSDAVAAAAGHDSLDPASQGPERPGEPDPDVAEPAVETETDETPTRVMAPVDSSSPAGAAEPTEEDTDDDEAGPRTIWRSDRPTTRWQKIWTLGGRVRGSTTGLIAGLIVTGLLLLFSANPDDADAGWLSPSYWNKTATSEPAADAADASETQAPRSAEPSATEVDTSPAPETNTDQPETQAPDETGARDSRNGQADNAQTTTRKRSRDDADAPTTADAPKTTVAPTNAPKSPAAEETPDAAATDTDAAGETAAGN